MASNSDLTPVQSAGTTGNPQNEGASDSASFQQSAGVDTLSENRPLSVAQTGNTVKGPVTHSGSLMLMWIFVVVATIVLVMIARLVFKWVMKRPDPVIDTNQVSKKADKTKKATKTDTVVSAPIPIVRPQSKKKLPRSKRNKK